MDRKQRRMQDQGNDLGGRLIRAMQAWADENTNETEAAVPLVALHFALTRCLEQLPPERRKLLAEDFCRALMRSVEKGAN
jgi:hypothetical protein